MEPQLPVYQVEPINRDRAQISIVANQLILVESQKALYVNPFQAPSQPSDS